MAAPLLAITFDVWETLLHDSPGSEAHRIALRAERMASILGRAGCPVEPEALVEAYWSALPDLEAIWAKARDFDTPEQVGYVLARLPGRLLPTLDPGVVGELAKAYAGVAFEYPPEIWPDTRSTVEEVARRGFHVGLVCNTGRTPGWVLRELLSRWGILEHFEALAFSNETGIRKPDPAIFAGVLEQLGVKAEESMHVGDDAITDIAGAKALGMRAVMIGLDSRHSPYQPDARLSRLGDLLPLLDEVASRTPGWG